MTDQPSPDIQFGRPFVLVRDTDVSGVSGTGIVANGIQWPDGQSAIHWTGSAYPTTTPHPGGMESVTAVHGHGGATRVVWEPSTLPQAEYSSVWPELVGWVQAAHEDGEQIDPAQLLEYLRELKHRAIAPVREWMAGIRDTARTTAGQHSCGNCDGVDPDTCLTNPHRAAGQTTHAAPHPDSGLTACCRKTPFELPHTDLMTTEPETVTCRQVAGQPAACGCGDPSRPNVIHRPGAPCYIDETAAGQPAAVDHSDDCVGCSASTPCDVRLRDQSHADGEHELCGDECDAGQPATQQQADDCPGCEAGIEHDEHCPTPETHNWGCGCASDQHPGARQHRANVLREAADTAHAEGDRLYDDVGLKAAEAAWGVATRLRRMADEAAQ